MKWFQQSYWQKEGFLRQVSTLVSGTVLAQVFSLLILPVLGVQYQSAAFGLQGLFIAVIHSLAIAVNGGYEVAIMLPKQTQAAKALLWLCVLLATLLSLLVGVGLLFGGTWFWTLLKTPEMVDWQWWLLGGLWVEGLAQPIRVLFNRLKLYRALSISRMMQAFVGGGVMLALGYLEVGFFGLLIGYVAGQIASLLLLMIRFLRWQAQINFPVSLADCLAVARTYRDFPTRSLWAGWLNTVSRQLPFYLLPSFFSQEIAGYYTMTNRALMAPFSLLSRSVGEVFYERAARAKERGKAALASLTRQTATYLSLVGLLPFLVVMVAAPFVVQWFLGESWYPSGEYARYLMPWIYLMFIASPLSYLIDVQRRLDFLFWYNVALFLVRLSALLMGGWYFSAGQTVLLYGAMGGLMVAFHIGFLLKIGHVWEEAQKVG